MSVEIDVVYEGELHCSATHVPSGSVLATDAPKDNEGRGETFSPTDLVGVALGTCIVTIMGIIARRDKLAIEGTKIHVVKEMAAKPSRRIGNLNVTITFPPNADLSDDNKKRLERCADTCPVKHSLHPDVAVDVKYVY